MWDIMTGVKKEPTDKSPEEDVKIYKKYANECSRYLLQTIDSQWIPILTANQNPASIWKALQDKFGIENPRTFFFQYKVLMQL